MGAQTFLDNFATIAEAPGGVQRLRELVVGLGVGGRLPTGRATDEPASKVIARARAELGISGPRPIPTGASAELGALPSGWLWAELGEIADHQLGKMLNKKTMTGRPVRYLRSVNIRDGFIDLSDLNEMLMQEYEVETYAIRDRDLLVIEGGDAGRSAIWSGPNPDHLAFQNQLHRLRPVAGILSAFLLLVIRHHRTTGEIAARSTGVTIKHFSAGALHRLPVPLPPRAEQERIVAKVDELMGLCDNLERGQERRHRATTHFRGSALHTLAEAETTEEVRHSWERAAASWTLLAGRPDCLDDLRSSILQLAVRGRLTAQDPADPPAAELVERTARERDEMVAKRLTRVVPDDPLYAQAGALPSGWTWAPLQDLVRFIDYRGRTPAKTNEGVPLVTAKNIRRGFISHTPREFIAERDFAAWMTRGLPRVGDVLFITEAPMGNAALIRENRRFALAQRTITLAPYADFIGAFLELMLLSPWFKDQLERRATGMTATGIKAAKLRLIRVPVPPVNEQARIVSIADGLLRHCDELGASLEREDQSATAMSAGLVAGMAAS